MIVAFRTVGLFAGLAACFAGCSVVGRWGGQQPRVLVSNYADDTVSVVDAATDREITVIAVGDSPAGLAVRPHSSMVAVANTTGGRVTLIDADKLAVVRTIEVTEIPEHVCFTTDGTLLFVTLPKARKLALVDPDAGRVLEQIDLGRKPKRLAVSPDGRRLYVLLHDRPGGVAVIDIASRTVEKTIATGSFPTDFGLTRDGRRLVAASFDDDNVTVIDTESLTPIATWPVGTGLGLVVHPTKPILYSMESFDGAVHVLNFETGEPITDLTPGEFPTYSAITADGRVLYIVNQDSHNVAKFDTETNERIERIAIGSEPANAVVVENW